MNASDLPDETLFEGALKCRTPAERIAYLDQACAGQPELRRRMEALLEAHDQSGEFLEPAAAAVRPTLKLELAAEEVSGTIMGRYKLLEKIGEGGCGVVYLAEQAEPVRRRVALKIIKPGMDSKSVIARFEAERQALAMMDHPSIAKVHDGGATEAGRPYFVMELVRGIRITDYCEQHNLSTGERLNLFLQVCQAVQHAHQKGIIHRDLKPSNILVTENDGKPVPKVIDFGIAKATEQKLTDKTLFTQFAQFIGTPAYVSPEQAAMTILDIDTRSDIYSLGVLLYELLTGTTPFDALELVEAGFDEMRRIIRETEPEKPSTRLSTRMARRKEEKGKGSRAAGAVLEFPSTLNSQLKLLSTDLDWIVMKCLEKDRTRRYETANGLAADIQRHLSNEPVVARPPSASYRFQKLVRRNKVVFSATAMVFAALVAGVAVSTWQAVRATQAERAQAQLRQDAEQARTNELALRLKAEAAEKKATEESAIATAVSDFLRSDLLQTASSEHRADLQMRANPNLTMAEALDRAAERVETRFQDQQLVEAAIRYTIGVTYGDMGEPWAAIAQLERALELRRSHLGREHDFTRRTLSALADAYSDAGRASNALPLYEECVRLTRSRYGEEHDETDLAVHNLAQSFIRNHRPSEAIQLLEKLRRRDETITPQEDRNTAATLFALAAAYSEESKPAKAIELAKQALQIHRERLGSEHPATGTLLHNLGAFYLQAGQTNDAVPLLEEALRLGRITDGSDSPNLLNTISLLAGVYQKLGRNPEAEALVHDSDRIGRNSEKKSPARTLKSLRLHASFLSGQGRFQEADPVFREAIELAREVAGTNPEQVQACVLGFAESLYQQQRYSEADDLLLEELSPTNATPAKRAEVLKLRGGLRARHGLWKEAAADLAKAVELQPDDPMLHHLLAPLLVQSGDIEGYRCHRQAESAAFGGSTDPIVAERVAKDSLILPSAVSESRVISAWADTAIAAGSNHWAWVFFQFAKGLCEYRQGNFAAAAEWTAEVTAASGQFPWRDVQAYAVLAMAHHQLRREAEAKAALAQGNEIANSKLPKLDASDFGDSWDDWVVAQTLLREANNLIEGTPGPSKGAGNKAASAKESPR